MTSVNYEKGSSEHVEMDTETHPQGLYGDEHHEGHSISKVATSNDGNYVFLGNKKFSKDDLMRAFGGTLTMGWSAPPIHKFANPAPLGLSAFAMNTFVSSMVNAGAMGIKNDNVVIGLGIFYGGFIQLLAGMWEMALENTWGALVLSSYGGYWMSTAAISIPWFNIKESYDDPMEFKHVHGIYLLGWTIFTFMVTTCTMKSTWVFFIMLVILCFAYLCLAISELADSANCKTAGGVLGVIVAFMAWYNAYAGLANKQNSYYVVKPLPIPDLEAQSANRESQ